MIDDNEAGARATAWFASIPVPPGTRLAVRWDLTRSQPVGWLFLADLLPIEGPTQPIPARGHGPVVVDRRNGAVTPLGTAGGPDQLFAAYQQRYAAAPPPETPLPPPATQPAPAVARRPRGRPTRKVRPRGPVPPRPWPPPGAGPSQPGAGPSQPGRS
jgi:hypothetical protein